MDYATQQELERFNSGWKQSEECKLWQKFLDKDGYGQFYFRKKNRRVHRFAYYIAYGPIPKNMVVDHTCRNRNCVNAAHLRLVTTKQNSLENSNSVGAINKAKTRCKNGHNFDRFYGQRYCSICEKAKKKRLNQKWLAEANKIAC